jgi:hypothetical protein
VRTNATKIIFGSRCCVSLTLTQPFPDFKQDTLCLRVFCYDFRRKQCPKISSGVKQNIVTSYIPSFPQTGHGRVSLPLGFVMLTSVFHVPVPLVLHIFFLFYLNSFLLSKNVKKEEEWYN